jgi:hypothetical protein
MIPIAEMMDTNCNLPQSASPGLSAVGILLKELLSANLLMTFIEISGLLICATSSCLGPAAI